ncbi:MAG: hypothetical protein U9N52_04770 [Campylobacterota bacterium]|nr:hypothetical protein [Campylobacterota bacterium]
MELVPFYTMIDYKVVKEHLRVNSEDEAYDIADVFNNMAEQKGDFNRSVYINPDEISALKAKLFEYGNGGGTDYALETTVVLKSGDSIDVLGNITTVMTVLKG